MAFGLQHLHRDQWQQLLVDKHLLDESEFQSLWHEAEHGQRSFSAILTEKSLLTRDELLHLAAEYYHLPVINLTTTVIDPQVVKDIPEVVAREYTSIAFHRDAEGLSVAICDPGAADELGRLRKKIDQPLKFYLAYDDAIRTAIESNFHSHLPRIEELIQQFGKKSEADNAELVTTLVEQIMIYALRNRAADVHIEPLAQRSIIRFRIDGVLHHIIDLPQALAQRCLNRLKYLAKIPVDDARAPYSGKIKFEFTEGAVDVRVSLAPVMSGQKVVLRLMGHGQRNLNLKDLGLQPQQLRLLESAIKRRQGLIITSGSVGSGRSSTLYAIIKKLNSERVNISTIEDPVEYDIEGVNQVQVQLSVGLDYIGGLRLILRQDADIIMVSSLSDVATSHLALMAAINGHVVLGSMDAPQAADVIVRCLEMGLEPYALTVGLRLVIGQRLVRKLCLRCRQEHSLGTSEREVIASQLQLEAKTIPSRLYKAVGCELCGQTGYRGRVGLFELLEITDAIKEMILKKASAEAIQQKAIIHGMMTMTADALHKAAQGLTTIDEIVSELRS